jgi:hypothetical protein
MSTTKPRRRWYQFSLGTMLLSLVIGIAVIGILGRKVREAREWGRAQKCLNTITVR